jgi:DNA invertase Pin-like site-specific DNA recombinase
MGYDITLPSKAYDLNNEVDSTFTEFQGFMARQEYKQITKRLRQGKKVGAKLGNWTNGKPPYPRKGDDLDIKINFL